MKAQDAARIAKDYVADLFGDEKPMNIGLEEVEYDKREGTWEVTVGFSRPWDLRNGLIQGATPANRAYKRVSLTKEGEVTAVRHHELEM